MINLILNQNYLILPLIFISMMLHYHFLGLRIRFADLDLDLVFNFLPASFLYNSLLFQCESLVRTSDLIDKQSCTLIKSDGNHDLVVRQSCCSI